MATYICRPVSDVKAQWTENPAGPAYSVLDDAVTQPTVPTIGSDRITAGSGNLQSFHGITAPTLVGERVVSVTAWAYGKAVDASNYWSVAVGNTVSSAAVKQTSGSYGWVSSTYTGSASQAQLNGIQIILVTVGTGLFSVEAAYIEIVTRKVTATPPYLGPRHRIRLKGR